MVLSEVVQGGDAYARTRKLIADSAQTDEEKAALYVRADEIFQTLIDAGVVERVEGGGGTAGAGDADDAGCTGSAGDAGGAVAYACTVDVPEVSRSTSRSRRFCWRRSSFWTPRTKAMRSTSSRLRRPRWKTRGRLLRAQERAARDKAMAEMKADGRGLRRAHGAHRRGHVPATARGPAGRRVRALLPGGAVGARLRAVAEVGGARHGGDGLGLQDLRAALQDRAVGGDAFCATWPTRTACSTARCRPTAATSGWRTSCRGWDSSCARWTRAWWTSGRARVR